MVRGYPGSKKTPPLPHHMDFILKVSNFDNRGTPEQPYGYIEFNDFTRLGYAPLTELYTQAPLGLNPDSNTPAQETLKLHELYLTQGLFDSNWGGNTVKHYTVALLWLRANVPSHSQKFPLKEWSSHIKRWYNEQTAPTRPSPISAQH